MLRRALGADRVPQIDDAELVAFAERVLADGRLLLRPPQGGLLFVEGVASIVLFREGQFQVEMVVVAPGVTVPPHVHDDVDSIEVAISGVFALSVAGVPCATQRAPRPNGVSRDFLRTVPIRHDAAHGGTASATGGVFLSIQHWRDGVKPTHVGLNWRGQTMGSAHTAAIA